MSTLICCYETINLHRSKKWIIRLITLQQANLNSGLCNFFLYDMDDNKRHVCSVKQVRLENLFPTINNMLSSVFVSDCRPYLRMKNEFEVNLWGKKLIQCVLVKHFIWSTISTRNYVNENTEDDTLKMEIRDDTGKF